MYKLTEEILEFYDEHVVLAENKVDELIEKKDTNITRLNSGLEKYNEKCGTDYSLKEHYIQGSIGMDTVTQSEDGDYDIDIGILIEGEDVDSIGSRKIKNIVMEAFEMIDIKFKEPPEKLTNCIRLVYAKGYQIDFAIYRENNEMEHAGSEWRERDPEAIQGWFDLKKLVYGEDFGKLIQLLKMFNKSRGHWNMPGGLITTILVAEEFASGYNNFDETLYYTIENIINRLDKNTDIKSPVFPYASILYKKTDKKKIDTFKSRLETYHKKLEALNEWGCTKLDAIEAWQSFFNHDYWEKLFAEEEKNANQNISQVTDTEEYISDHYPVRLEYQLKIEADIEVDGFRKMLLTQFTKRMRVPISKTIEFYIKSNNVPRPYDIYWKVRNVGVKAYEKDMIRGQLQNTNRVTHNEPSRFKGRHFVECYIVKDGVCVAKDRLDVPI